MFTTPFQLTKSMHRDVYPAVDPTNPALSAKGKVVIITGAGGGLGAVSLLNPLCEQTKLMKSLKAIARAWAQAGAAGLVLVGRTAETLKLTADQISKIDGTIPFIAEPTDISDESSVKSLFEKVVAKFGTAGVLVNNAASHASGSIGEIPFKSWWGDYVRNLRNHCSGVHLGCISDGISFHRKPTSRVPSSPPNLSSKPSETREPSSTSSA